MPHAIQITIGKKVFGAELNDTGTAAKILETLPIEGEVNRWGDEIYFAIPVKGDKSDAMRTEMSIGELAYWPPGAAFCIFWGPTPASEGDEPRAASNVVPVGRLVGDIKDLSASLDGQPVRIERAAPAEQWDATK
ncbi:MAG: cyclophilin-like fold protein [Phycisphaerae bacterium]|nr:cyclophilin-like fold protein [Phycisphaerae bacterium]